MSYLCALQTHSEAIIWNTKAELNAWTHLGKTNALFIKRARIKVENNESLSTFERGGCQQLI